jgi:hypothetical protein
LQSHPHTSISSGECLVVLFLEFDFPALPQQDAVRASHAQSFSEVLEVVMPTDPSVLAAIQAAVEANPENTALRLHLVSLLLAAERPGEALQHCVHVLNTEPDNLEALRLATHAAGGVGDVRRAESYRRLAQALSGQPSASGKDEELWPDDLALPDNKPTAPPPPLDQWAGVVRPGLGERAAGRGFLGSGKAGCDP